MSATGVTIAKTRAGWFLYLSFVVLYLRNFTQVDQEFLIVGHLLKDVTFHKILQIN